MSEFQFTERHAEALRTVQLHLHGVVHGDYFQMPEGYGGSVYVDCAPDASYRGVKKLIGSLSVECGDAVSCEYPKYTPAHQQDLESRNKAALSGDVEFGQHPDMLAYRRLVTPLEYARDLALNRKIPAHYSDVSKEEQDIITEVIGELPWLGRLAIKSFFALRNGPREQIKLIKLANIASTMQSPNPDEKPVLAHVVGASHVTTMGPTLRAAQVPFTSNTSILEKLNTAVSPLRRVGPKEVRRRRMKNARPNIY